MKQLHLLGYASAAAGVDEGCARGPVVLQQSSCMNELRDHSIAYQWGDFFYVDHKDNDLRVDEKVRQVNLRLAQAVSNVVKQKAFFSVIGGDHSSAIGTWSGVYHALHQAGEVGLIWIDAHMDSHTPETSESGRIHGMPLAVLLGYGYPTLTSILHDTPKIKPENLCLIGVRSYESGEVALLKRLNVRIYFMQEVADRGIDAVLRDAVSHVTKNTIAYGVSIDLDGIDPVDAPGVDVPEPNGIRAADLSRALENHVVSDLRFIGAEIVEFNPARDKQQLTEKLIIKLLHTLANGKKNDNQT
jgi:arginase